MRLRQLGTTQSVVFFAPPEVHKDIVKVCKPGKVEIIKSSHVVTWLLEQTCRTNEQLQHLYLAQGKDFCRRLDAEVRYPNRSTNQSQRTNFLEVIQSPEHQTLEKLYGNGLNPHAIETPDILSSSKLQLYSDNLKDMATKSRIDHVGTHNSALEEVEQEREVEFQVEEIREMQVPTHYDALGFTDIHNAIFTFASTGKLKGKDGYENAFEALKMTSIGNKFQVCGTQSRLFVSTEYMRTIDLQNNGPNDSFLVSTMLTCLSHQSNMYAAPSRMDSMEPI